MPKISQLPSLTTADNADEIAIVDVSASTTKKITRGDFLKSPLPANAINTQAIADGAVTASKLDSAAWLTWTPTFTNFNLGNGTAAARFIRMGSVVNFRIRITLGSTSSVTGRIALSLPVNSAAGYGTGTDAFVDTTSMYRDISASVSYIGSSIFETTSSIGLGLPVTQASGSASPFVFASINSTTPFIWANGDIISVQGTYEAAV